MSSYGISASEDIIEGWFPFLKRRNWMCISAWILGSERFVSGTCMQVVVVSSPRQRSRCGA